MPGEDAKKEKTSTKKCVFVSTIFMTTSNNQVWFRKKNAKICRPIGQDGAKLTAEDSAVEAYLLVGAVLKPEVDRRQLTIYAPPAASCKNPEPNFSAVLWLLGR